MNDVTNTDHSERVHRVVAGVVAELIVDVAAVDRNRVHAVDVHVKAIGTANIETTLTSLKHLGTCSAYVAEHKF